MKNEMVLDGYGVVELGNKDQLEFDGGYGYHPSQVPGSITVGKAIGQFFENFFGGLSDCSCVNK